jgi:hypothetical protein
VMALFGTRLLEVSRDRSRNPHLSAHSEIREKL